MYIIAAAICSHASSQESGFRQKDIKFAIEMFSNWMDMTLNQSILSIHNTQVMRYLNMLVKEGWAKVSKRNKVPFYKLTGVGLLTLISKLVNHPPEFPIENFYFRFHVLETYHAPIEALIRAESKKFPESIKIEIDFLLNMEKIIDRQIEFLEFEQKKLKKRMSDSQTVSKIVAQFRSQKKNTNDLIAEIEKRFPYDLNNQKPLSEFYQEIPEPLRNFILDVAISKRVSQLWDPIDHTIANHLQNFKKLKENLKK